MFHNRAVVLRRAVVLLFVALVLHFPAEAQQRRDATTPPDVRDLLLYIHGAWDKLTCSMNDCETVLDKRVPEHSVLYLPADFPETETVKTLGERCKVQIKHLPKRIPALGDLDPKELAQQGVLYLPNPYIVPGGFFNEMYGWDSYFIIRGLLRDGRLNMARGMVENFFFEIDHYGAILNANRTYFLTRSQPPFLSSMVMAVYGSLPDAASKRAWLEKSYPYIERDYKFWTSGEHLAGGTGLSRYYDYGQGPVPEITEMHDPYYRDVFLYLQGSPRKRDYLKQAGEGGRAELTGPAFTYEACEHDAVGCAKSPEMQFTADYYKGDRAMRESGFDVTFRFGPYGGSTDHFAPAGLNCLLYKAEGDLENIANLLGKTRQAKEWTARAEHRRGLMTRYLWNASKGMFFDYDFTTSSPSHYEYVTTFYPLWTGLATPAQAKAILSNLKTFEKKGGLLTSPYDTGVQWDAPYGWAPMQLIAVEGMLRYGARRDADRIAREWVSTVAGNFRREGTIREKYNVVTATSETAITAGYKQNVVGFGWTNGVTLVFIHQLGLDQAGLDHGKASAATAR
jgi:alpha,alpha-trehalase